MDKLLKIWPQLLFEGETGTGTQPVIDPTKPAVDPAKPVVDPAKPAEGTQVADGTQSNESWKDRRLAEVTFQREEEKRLRAAREAENQKLRARLAAAGVKEDDDDDATAQPVVQPTRQQPTQEDVARVADVLAESKAKDMLFNKACNDVHAAGVREHKDFADKVGVLKQTGFLDNREALETAVNLEGAQDVLYYLGNNPARAQEIAAMPSVQRTIALVQLNTEIKASKDTSTTAVTLSAAPKPVNTLKGGTQAAGSIDLYDTKNTSMDDWVRNREAQIAERRANRR